MAGLKNGYAITDLQNQRAQQARDLAIQQQKRNTVQALVNNPNATGDDYMKAGILVPELSAQFKQAWDTKNTAQQQNQLNQMVQWSAAIQNGQPKIASDDMRAQADALENTSGGPTPESKALRAKADQVDANPQTANFVLKSIIAANPKGKNAIDGIVALGGEQRAADAAPAELTKKKADAAMAAAGVVGQAAGALAKPGVKPAQAITMFRLMESRGFIPKGGAQEYIDNMPARPEDLPDYLKQVQESGMKVDDQKKFTTPDANAQLSANTTRRGQDINANTAAARLAFDKDQANSADQPGKPNESMAKMIASYRSAPLGQFALNKPWGQATMDRVAELNPAYDAAQYPARSAAVRSFAAGKDGANVESANTALHHLIKLILLLGSIFVSHACLNCALNSGTKIPAFI
ncbi:hypothetical protein [Massilia phosphatilytica]